MREPLEEEDQQPAVDRKAGDCRRRWDLLHSSGPHAQEPNETAGKTAGRLQVESSLPGASNETTCFLEAVGTLAGLLLTEESLDLRHPLCLAP